MSTLFRVPAFTRTGLRTLLCIAVAGLTLSACETERLATRMAVALPIPVRKVQVVYERGNLDRQVEQISDAVELSNQRNLYRFLIQSLQERIPAGLEKRNIPADFLVRDIDNSAPTIPVAAKGEFSHELRIRVLRDVQVCREQALCSHQLTIRASILAAGSAAVLWNTEIQEAAVQPLRVEPLRAQTLTNTLSSALTYVMRVNQ